MAAVGNTTAAAFLQVKKNCLPLNFLSVVQTSGRVYTVFTGRKRKNRSSDAA